MASGFVLTAELMPHFCFALPVFDFASLAAAARVWRNALDSLPVAFWKSYMRRCVELHLDEGTCAIGVVPPLQNSFDKRTLRKELQLWLKSAHALSLPISNNEWLFRDQVSLVAARGMLEDALELLREHSTTSMYPWTAHRLTFSFSEASLGEIRERWESAADRTAQQNIDIQWDFESTGFFVRNVFIPCRVSLRWHSCAEKPAWEVSFELQLSRSEFPIYSRGVQKALVVHLFSSGTSYRVSAPRSVSFMGMDGQVSLLTTSAPETNAGKLPRSCGWMEQLLMSGRLHAIALLEHVSYMM